MLKLSKIIHLLGEILGLVVKEQEGISFFNKSVSYPKYYLWSNNFEGLNEFLNSNNIKFVNVNNKKDPAYDLYLMSLCKHFILSPSTLHYWAAFLSKHDKKICLAPPNVKNISGCYGFSNNIIFFSCYLLFSYITFFAVFSLYFR